MVFASMGPTGTARCDHIIRVFKLRIDEAANGGGAYGGMTLDIAPWPGGFACTSESFGGTTTLSTEAA